MAVRVTACLVISNVPILAPATVACGYRSLPDPRLDFLHVQAMEPHSIACEDGQLRVHRTVKVLLHVAAEAVRVPAGQLAALPVEALVHVKDSHVPQADTFTVDEVGKRPVPAAWPAGDDRPQGPAFGVGEGDLVHELARHKPAHALGICAQAERHPGPRMTGQLLIRNAAPLEEHPGRNG